MIHIAICDDEKQICTALEAALEKILSKLNIKYEIDIFSSGERLLQMQDMARYSLIFLDICFAESKTNGVAVGKHIRGTLDLQGVSIVYISWEKEYSLQLHEIRPLNFLIKPLEYEKIEQTVTNHLKLSKLLADDFVYKIRHDTFRAKVKDIVYFESSKRKLTMYLSGGKKEVFYATLKDIYQQQLQKFDFLLIHASFAVNCSYISAFLRDSVTLTTGETLPISKMKKSEAEETYFAIMERQGVV